MGTGAVRHGPHRTPSPAAQAGRAWREQHRARHRPQTSTARRSHSGAWHTAGGGTPRPSRPGVTARWTPGGGSVVPSLRPPAGGIENGPGGRGGRHRGRACPLCRRRAAGAPEARRGPGQGGTHRGHAAGCYPRAGRLPRRSHQEARCAPHGGGVSADRNPRLRPSGWTWGLASAGGGALPSCGLPRRRRSVSRRPRRRSGRTRNGKSRPPRPAAALIPITVGSMPTSGGSLSRHRAESVPQARLRGVGLVQCTRRASGPTAATRRGAGRGGGPTLTPAAPRPGGASCRGRRPARPRGRGPGVNTHRHRPAPAPPPTAPAGRSPAG
jgi:hypothetical protein